VRINNPVADFDAEREAPEADLDSFPLIDGMSKNIPRPINRLIHEYLWKKHCDQLDGPCDRKNIRKQLLDNDELIFKNLILWFQCGTYNDQPLLEYDAFQNIHWDGAVGGKSSFFVVSASDKVRKNWLALHTPPNEASLVTKPRRSGGWEGGIVCSLTSFVGKSLRWRLMGGTTVPTNLDTHVGDDCRHQP